MIDRSNGLSVEVVEAALKRAGAKAVRVAKQTGTKVVVWRDGHPLDVSPEEFDDAPWMQEANGEEK